MSELLVSARPPSGWQMDRVDMLHLPRDAAAGGQAGDVDQSLLLLLRLDVPAPGGGGGLLQHHPRLHRVPGHHLGPALRGQGPQPRIQTGVHGKVIILLIIAN